MSKSVLSAALAIIMAAVSCSENKPNPAEEKARDLFSKSLTLTNVYIDSISAATDSATLLGLDARFDEAMTDLNYRYAPDIAVRITEGENDTLVNLTDRYVAIRDSLLYRFAHPVVQRDSLSPDSI